MDCVKPDDVAIDAIQTDIVVILTDFLKGDQTSLDPKTLALFRVLLEKSPASFQTIASSLKDILKDGKIDSTDIPTIVVLVTKLHTTDFAKVLNGHPLDNALFVSLIQTIVRALIESKYIQVATEEKEKLYAALDISLRLLSVSLDISFPNISTKCC